MEPPSLKLPSDYLRLLPAIYRNQGQNAGYLLKPFEKIFSGIVVDELWAAEKLANSAFSPPADEWASYELLAQRGLGELLSVIDEFVFPRFSFLFADTNRAFLPPLDDRAKLFLAGYLGVPTPDGAMGADTESVDAWLDEWLQWVAGWTGFILDQQWNLERKRLVLAKLLPLYRIQGTREGLRKMLDLFLMPSPGTKTGVIMPDSAAIKKISVLDSQNYPIQPKPITVGTFVLRGEYSPGDPVVGGMLPFSVQVIIELNSTPDSNALQELRNRAETVIRRSKPAQCHAKLILKIVTFATSVEVGVDSLLGNWDGAQPKTFRTAG